MDSIIKNVTKSQIIEKPFPHLVLQNALPEELYKQLALSYPSLEIITKIKTPESNKRFNLSTSHALNSLTISSLWGDFLKTHTSQDFFNKFLDLFKEHILKTYPHFENKVGKLDKLTTGIRGINTFSHGKVLLDAQFAINTPVFGTPTSIRGTHLDRPNKLFTGLYYFRHPEDSSKGGDLEICRLKKQDLILREKEMDSQYFEVIKTIKYQPNTLVLFLNTINSFHAVTVREVTTFPRLFINLLGEVEEPLFSLGKEQISLQKKIQRFFVKKVKRLVYG